MERQVGPGGISQGLDRMEKTLSHTTLDICHWLFCSEASALHQAPGPSHLIQP